MNEKYISENLCVNKNKPKCCCHGKCFLKKRLNKDENGDSNGLPQKEKENIEILWFVETTPSFEAYNFISPKNFLPFQTSLNPQSFCDGCFRPPQFVS